MQYFLDSAKMDEIKYAVENWGIDGLTTNPKHVYLAGKTFDEVLKELSEYFKDEDFPISVEINPHIEEAEPMYKEAKRVSEISENFVIKIGCTEQGLVAAKRLIEDGVKVNMTLVFSPSQALQCGRIGATYVSPFVGWKEASGEECSQFIADITQIYRNYGFDTEIIVAALRNGKQLVDAALMGADITTAGFDVYKTSFYHPFTDYGLKVFQEAWDKTEKNK